MSVISNLTTDAPLWDTSVDHGPLVSVMSWFLVITAFLSVLACVSTRYVAVRQVSLGDVSMVLAMLLAIGQSITTSLQASNGLGEHIESVSPDRLTRFQKSTYASGFLYIGALSAIKISICLHLNSVTPVRLHKAMILCVGAFTCLWMVSCFFAIGFQCQLPNPWQFVEGNCIDITGFWTYSYLINILTDLALVAIPWLILSKLQVKVGRKIIIIGCFSARLLVVVVTIVQICFLQTKAANSEDQTFDLWTVVLTTSIVQTLSLVAACIPYLKPFMVSLETGMLRADGGAQSRSHGFKYGIRSTDSYNKYRVSSKPSSKQSRSQLGDVRMDNLGFSKLGDAIPSKQSAAATATDPNPDWDNDSQSSQSNIIRKTVGWSVTEEKQEPQIPPRAHSQQLSHKEYLRAA